MLELQKLSLRIDEEANKRLAVDNENQRLKNEIRVIRSRMDLLERSLEKDRENFSKRISELEKKARSNSNASNDADGVLRVSLVPDATPGRASSNFH